MSVEVEPCPACPFCGGEGDYAYRNLRDPLFDAPGEWSFRLCARAACGTYWLDPRPAPAALPEIYRAYMTHSEWQSLGDRWRPATRAYLAARYGYPSRLPAPIAWLRASPAVLWRPEIRGIIDVNVRWLSGRQRGRVLDVGCGNGQALGHLRDLGWQVAGVEIDAAAAGIARAHGISVHQGPLDSAPYAPGSFDAVALSHVIEHVHEPAALLRQAKTLLRPGGTLVVAAPNARGSSHHRHGRHWYSLHPPYHLFVPSPEALAALVAAAGFTGVRTRLSYRNISTDDYICRRLARGERYRWGEVPQLRRGDLPSLLLSYRAPIEGALGIRAGDEIVLHACAP